MQTKRLLILAGDGSETDDENLEPTEHSGASEQRQTNALLYTIRTAHAQTSHNVMYCKARNHRKKLY